MSLLERLLPGYNCGECGRKSCRDFAEHLSSAEDLSRCPYMSQERFRDRLEELRGILERGVSRERIVGVMDGLEADFSLGPLDGEISCTEDIHPLEHCSLRAGDLIRYRPLGCPITHFAEVLEFDHGVARVRIVGPLFEGRKEYMDLGICMVLAFEGRVVRGRVPEVGKTVRFLPEHCMMQKVHSGVVVHSEGSRVRIEAIDLKVW
ncbi:MAG: (Fe-S)-binding protein [Methanothrix sp.]